MGNIETEPKLQNTSNVDGFVMSNRKWLLGIVIAVVVVIVVVVAALIVLDTMNAKAITKLETYVTTFDAEKDNFSDVSNEEVKTLLENLESLGDKFFGYPASRAFLMAGDIYKEQNDWANAESMWLKSAAKGSKTHLAPVALFNAGVAAEEQNNADAAIDHYKKASAYDDFPQAAHAQFSIARILKEDKSDTEASLAAYRELLEKWPSDTAWANLAQTKILEIEIETGLTE
ncbi:MAG: hypothetical protein Ta2F_10940 [Termitinemataceae bacterium]|nr:MAG: hypothetical protein Ta2F_10940 [Termitinemataceae bacterium]